MSKWYDNNPNRVIDARLAYEGAGAIGRGISGAGKAMSGYAKLKYDKKRDKVDDAFKEKTHKNSNDLAQLKLDLGYDDNMTKKQVSRDRVEDNKRTVGAKNYATDGSVANNKRTVHMQGNTNQTSVKVANIGANAKTTSAKLKLQGTTITAGTSRANNINTSNTSVSTTNTKAKSQKYTADKQFEGAKLKSKSKKNSVPKWKKDLLKSARTHKQIDNILKMKNDLGDEDI